MTELSYEPPTEPQGFTPRTGRLVTAGILLILAACVTGCITLATPLSLFTPPARGGLQPRQVVNAFALYGLVTAGLMTLGIGVLMPRRWARPLILILATHWLIVGTLTFIGTAAMMPMMSDAIAAANTSSLPAGYVRIVLAVSLGSIFVTMVVWPLALLLLTRGDDVRRTLEWKDPITRWTDRCPPDILGLSITLAVFALFALFAGAQPVLPTLGLLLRQPLNLVLGFALAAVLGMAAVRSYRLQLSGWRIGLWAVLLPLLSYVPNGWLLSLRDFYNASGISMEQAGPLLKHEAAARVMMIVFPLFFAAAFVLYMLRVRRTFTAADQERSRSAVA